MPAQKGVSFQTRCAQARRRDPEALALRMQGLNYAEIAAQLGVTEMTAWRGVRRELRRRGAVLTFTIVPAGEIRDLEAAS